MVRRDQRRQPEREGGPAAHFAPYGHRPAVRLVDELDDRQAEAGTARGPAPVRVHPEEPVEDPLLIGVGDPDAIVGDRDLDHLVVTILAVSYTHLTLPT